MFPMLRRHLIKRQKSRHLHPQTFPSLDSSLPFSIHLSIHLPTFLLLLDCSLNKLLVIEQLLPAVLVLAIYPRCSAFCATNTSVLWFVATLLVMPPKILIHHRLPPIDSDYHQETSLFIGYSGFQINSVRLDVSNF